MKILLMRSDNALSDQFEKVLKGNDYQYITIPDYEKAIDILRAPDQVNFVIADLDSVRESAVDLIVMMRNSELHTHTPVMIYSVMQDHPLERKCREFPEVYSYNEDFTDDSLIRRIEEIRGTEGKKILLVDDEVMVRDVLKVALEREGYDILEASTANEALELMSDNAISLVISDLKMPGMSGHELLRHIKDKNPEIPVFLISGYIGDATNDDILKSGADGFIAKPFKFTEIISIVRKGLSDIAAASST